ncbi:MAG: hypothetical protein ACK4WS_07270 [Burkholderiales bacterium]|jgi:hypothetical protein
MVNSVTDLGGPQIIAQNQQPPTLNSNQKVHITRLFQDIVHGSGVPVSDLLKRLNAVNINVDVGLKALIDEIGSLMKNDIGSLKPRLEQVLKHLETLYESKNNLESRKSEIIGGLGRSPLRQFDNEVRPNLQRIIDEVDRP